MASDNSLPPVVRRDFDALKVRQADQRPLPDDAAGVLDHQHAAGVRQPGGQKRQLAGELVPFGLREFADGHEGLPPSTSSVTGTFTDADFR